MVSLQKPENMENLEQETVFYKDIRFWLAIVLAFGLLYITASTYPVLW